MSQLSRDEHTPSADGGCATAGGTIITSDRCSIAWSGAADTGPPQAATFRQAAEVHAARARTDIANKLDSLVSILSSEHERRHSQLEKRLPVLEQEQGEDRVVYSSTPGSLFIPEAPGSTRNSHFGGGNGFLLSEKEGGVHASTQRRPMGSAMGATFSDNTLSMARPRNMAPQIKPWQTGVARPSMQDMVKRGGSSLAAAPGSISTSTALAAVHAEDGRTVPGPKASIVSRDSRAESGEEFATDCAEVLPLWIQADRHLRKAADKLATLKSGSLLSVGEDLFEKKEIELLSTRTKFIQDRVLQPGSGRRLFWDFIGLFLIAYDITVIPLQFFDPFQNEATRALAWFARVFWTCDIPLGFMTGFMFQDGDYEMRLSKIAGRYFRTWLVVDVVIVLVDWIDLAMQNAGMGNVSTARMGKTVRIMRMLRIVRLIRMAKLPILAGTSLEHYLRSEKVMLVASMTKLMLCIVILMHFIACVWYGIGKANGDLEGWVRVFEGRPPPEEDILYRYMTSFHWSLTQFTGTMEVTPATTGERVYAVFVLLAAFAISASFISNITSSLTRLNIISGNETSMFASLRDYLIGKGFSRKLMVRVQRNARHVLLESRQNCPEKDVDLLQIISEPLRVEIHFELHAPVLRMHPLFRLMEEENPSLVRKMCHSAVCTTFLSAGDPLFVEGEEKEPPEMYFITKGEVLYKQFGRGTAEVSEGAWLSEPVLWCQWAHRGLLKARSECELLVLSANAFRAIALQTKNTNNNLNLGRYAIEYIKLINQDLLTDVDEEGLAVEAMNKAFSDGIGKTSPKAGGRASGQGGFRNFSANLMSKQAFGRGSLGIDRSSVASSSVLPVSTGLMSRLSRVSESK